MPTSTGVLRMVVGIVVIGVLVYTYVLGIPAGRADPFDYFGYFTNLTSLLAAGVLIAVGARTLRDGRPPAWLHLTRGAAVTAMIVVALIYNLVVPGTGTAPGWVSVTLHLAFPLLLLVDWLVIADRPPLEWRRIWLVLPYPLLWVGVTLVRGVTDGWVPYGFLLPSRGVAQLAATVGMLMATLLVCASLVWAMSRIRVFEVAPQMPPSIGSRLGVRPTR
jgi:hypothetical protein